MHVVMHVNDVDLAEAFTSYVERRLRFGLGRFGDAGGPDHCTHRCRRPGRAPVPH